VQQGLSLQTLVIASLASVTAAIVVHEVWEGGVILGAAITPIIVAIVSEALRRPAERLRPVRPAAAGEAASPATPPATAPDGDRYGIWTGRTRRETIQRRVRLGLLTGLLAFGIGALALTTTELVFGGAATGGDRTTLLGGDDEDRDDDRTTTAPETVTTTAPAVTETVSAPGDTAPQATTPAGTEPPDTPPTTTPTQTAPPPTTPGQPPPPGGTDGLPPAPPG